MGPGRSSLLRPRSETSRTARASQPPERGHVLSRYRLCRRLGSGAFGTVWLARDERLQRDVAIKLLPRERLQFARFEREARATARLNHPGIVTLYEAAADDEGAYLVSELVRGNTLAQLLEEGSLSDQDVLRMGVALCDALQYAHHHGVVHRDVKPSNVLVPEDPVTDAEMAKLTDFGVARLVGGDSLTRTGDVIGTTGYMAPEQAEGREAQPCADLYSLALVIYEALTGVNPLRVTAPAVRGGRLGVHLPALRRHRRDLPRELAGGIDLALRPRPGERGTIVDLRAALATSLGHVGDRPGVVAAPWSVRRRDRAEEPLRTWTEREPTAPGCPREPDAQVELASLASARPAASRYSRLLAATAAAAATAWFATSVLSPLPLGAGAAVVGAGLLVLLAPRLGWLLLITVALGLLVAQAKPGAALVLAGAVMPTLILLLGHAERWPLPAVASALGLLGLGGVWPVLAGRGTSGWQRATLGLTGWIWLLAAGLLSGRDGYVRLPSTIPAPREWMGSLHDTVHRVLPALLSGGMLVPAIVWAVGALVLPLATRRVGRSGRVVVLAGWAAAVPLLAAAALGILATGASLVPDQAAAGAVIALLLALAVGVLQDAWQRTRSSDRWARLA